MASFRPQSIRDGWVTGLAGAATGSGERGTPVRLHLAADRFVDLPSRGIWPQHGNGQGWVAGGTPDGRAALITDRGQLALPGLVDAPRPVASIAWRVSDDGRTVSGQSDNAKGDPQAVRWRCR